MFAQSTFGPPPVRIRRVKKHLSTIADDDAFLVRENHGEWLNALELREALEERAGDGTHHLDEALVRIHGGRECERGVGSNLGCGEDLGKSCSRDNVRECGIELFGNDVVKALQELVLEDTKVDGWKSR